MENTLQTYHNVLRLKKLKIKTGLSGASIYNKLNPKCKYFDASFPRPIKLGSSAVGWLESEIDAWLGSRRELS
ncbi:MAG: AlpA family phage regulatory protein [Burkholderiaceae bacterium]|nr:AlpA family phage regulatory protein [Burkholderiaceae bacterium]